MRKFPTTAIVAASLLGLSAVLTSQGSPAVKPIRQFHVNIPEAKLEDLRKRIHFTVWPEKETVADSSQGVPLATMQALARYWAEDYDWRKAEARVC